MSRTWVDSCSYLKPGQLPLPLCRSQRSICQAARLRAEYRLRPPDALQVSACLLGGAKVYVTNDRQIIRLREKLDIAMLDDLARTANMQNDSFSQANLTQVSTVRDGTAHRINGLVADE